MSSKFQTCKAASGQQRPDGCPMAPPTLQQAAAQMPHLAKGRLHGQLRGVARIDTGAEWLDQPLEDLIAEVPADKLLHRLLA